MGRFRSRAQWRWAFANRMPWARKWAHRNERAKPYRSLPRRARGGRRRR
ncbi:hypothetical protein SEA_ONIONKNIGHT_7 [Streptomyces phage OnionKnight]|nr:hypothetical protein SEA_ONIONKNIGHT_7 [Streptomyces phage OnionKnight]